MKKLFGILGAIVALSLVSTVQAAFPTPTYHWHDKGVITFMDPGASLYSMSGDISSTAHRGSGEANVQTSFLVPSDAQWLLIQPSVCAACGWTDSSTGAVAFTASSTGDADGGDPWGFAHFGRLVYDGDKIFIPPSRLQNTEYIYFFSPDAKAPGLVYSITIGSR